MIYHEDLEINTVIEKCVEHFEKTGENPTMAEISAELGYELSIDDTRFDDVFAGLASAGLIVEDLDDEDLTRMLEPASVQESTDPQRIYMKELGSYALLTRDQEFEYADAFNQSMRDMLRILATIPAVMEKARRDLESFQPATYLEQLYSDEPASTNLSKEQFNAQATQVVQRICKRWDAYIKRPLGRRSDRQLAALEADFSSLKFKPKYFSEYVRAFEDRVRELKRTRDQLRTRVLRVGVSETAYAVDFEPHIANERLWQSAVAALSSDLQRDLTRKTFVIAELRNRIETLENELGWDYESLIEKKHNFELHRRTNDAALNSLVEGNLRLVMSNAQKYLYTGIPLLDLVQEGNLGLIRAAQKYEMERGFRFSTYATWWIKQAITRLVDGQRRNVRLPANVTTQVKKVTRAQQELQTRFGRVPKSSELAAHLKMNVQKLQDILKYGQLERQIDAPLGDEDGASTLGDKLVDIQSVSPEVTMVRDDKYQTIIDALMDLPTREGKVVLMYYGIAPYASMSQEVIAEELGISRERVKIVCDQALQRLRENETLRHLDLD